LTDYRTWLPIITELSESNRVIAISLRRYFPEQWKGEGTDLSLQQHANDVAAFISALNLEPVHLLGHSRGGDVALLLASQHPSMVKNLILAEPAPMQSMLSSDDDALNELDKRKTKYKKIVSLYRQGQSENGLEEFVDYLFGPETWNKTSESRKERIRANSWNLVSLVKDINTPFVCENAKKITAPVLFIKGDNSPALYGSMVDALQECMNNVSVATIANSGHVMYSANPTAFIFETQMFLEQ